MATHAVLLTRTYDETLDMIVEARDYMTDWDKNTAPRLGGTRRLQFCCEALRVTSRLTQALAWLMVQRAVHEGELTLIEACENTYRLSGHEVCLNTASANDNNLPEKLRSLMSRSYRLYNRISRLEEMVVSRVSAPSHRPFAHGSIKAIGFLRPPTVS